jgi:hypothetical protein
MMHRPPEGIGKSASVAALRAGLALSELSFNELCIGYLTMGGRLAPAQLRDALDGRATLSSFDHDVVAVVLNEHFLARGLDHPVPYFDELAGAAGSPERPPPGLAQEQRLAAEDASDTAGVMHETAKLRADLASRYEGLAQTSSEPLRERYRERARRFRFLAQRAERFANEQEEVRKRREGPEV